MKHIQQLNPTAAFPHAVRERIANEVAKIDPAKRCSVCKTVKPFDDFHRNTTSHDGRQSVCKVCKRRQSNENYHRDRASHAASVRARRERDRRWKERLAAMKAGAA